MKVALLGELVVDQADAAVRIGSLKERSVLAILALRAGRAVPRDELIEALWGEEPPRSAQKAVQMYVSNLRRVLPAASISTSAGGYTLAIAPDDVDSVRFEESVVNGRRCLQQGDAVSAAQLLRNGLTLWRGRPLMDLTDTPVAIAEAARLEELRRGAEEDLTDVRLSLGDHQLLIASLEAAVVAEPLRERRWCQLMIALYRCGRQAEALRAFRRVESLLAEELGIEPGSELRQLEDAVLLQKADLDWRKPGSSATECRPADGGPAAQPWLPSGTVTFMFTDVEGSTHLLRRLGPSYPRLLERHRELIRTAVSRNGGFEVGVSGDGLFFAFPGAVGAVAACIDAQLALAMEPWPDETAVSVRMGLHTGEATPEGGNYAALAVHQAARVSAAAHGGQILLSEVTVAAISLGPLPPGVSVIDTGVFRLRDFDAPAHLFQICHIGLMQELRVPHAAPAVRALPARVMANVRQGPFVGRDGELATCERVLDEAASGQAQLLLLVGPAGIGKTRLAAEVAIRAHKTGTSVLMGGCNEEGLVSYQPFLECLYDFGIDLARMVSSAAANRDPEGERFRLFEAVTAALADLAATNPTLFVLEDLQWADQGSMLLLRHVLRRIPPTPLLLLGTFRRDVTSDFQEIQNLLGGPVQDGVVRTVRLGRLAEVASREVVRAAQFPKRAGDGGSWESTAVALGDGNPFFLREIARQGAERPSPGGPTTLSFRQSPVPVPESLQQVLVRRLATTGQIGTATLLIGASLGSEFDLSVLAAVQGDDAMRGLDEAVRCQLLEEVPASPAKYRFAHALLREVAYGLMAPEARAQLHLRVAEALSGRAAADPAMWAADVAHHLILALPFAAPSQVVSAAHSAGDAAMATLGFEEAATWYGRALDLLAQWGEGQAVEACELWLQVGRATTASGDWRLARDAYERAGRLAIAAQRPSLLAASALGYAGQWQSLGGPDPTLQWLATKALEKLASDEHGTRAKLLARLAHASYAAGDAAGASLSDEALTAADRSGEPEAVCLSLHACHVVHCAPPEAVKRLEIADQMVALAVAGGYRDLAQIGRWDRVLDLIELGRHADAGLALGAFQVEGARTGRPVDRWWAPALGATLATVAGRFAEAEALAASAADAGNALEPNDALTVYAVQVFAIRWAQARLTELRPQIEAAAASQPTVLGWRAGLAVIQAESGDYQAARSELARVTASRLDRLPRDRQWLATLVLLAHAASQSEARDAAAMLYQLLRTQAGCFVVLGPGVAAFGPVDRWLGDLAVVLDQPAAANEHYVAAIRLSEAADVPRWGRPALAAQHRLRAV